MSTWTTISNSAVAVGGIPASSTVTALRDNPVAIAKAATGSPAVFAGWHPVAKDSVGDAEDGLIYDSAVNGTVASVETPNFQDGYEYRILGRDLSGSTGGVPAIGLYRATSASWYNVNIYSSINSSSITFFDIELSAPRISTIYHLFKANIGIRIPGEPGTFEQSDIHTGVADFTSAQKVGKARFIYSAGNIDAGKIWLFRRREYASAP